MYGYYGLTALKVKISRSIAKLITYGQIAQMIAGFYINAHILLMKLTSGLGEQCQTSLEASVLGVLLYGLFLYYFVCFFIDTYVKGGRKEKNKTLRQKN